MNSPYSLFVAKCEKYEIKNTIPEETYLRLSEQYREIGFAEIENSVLQWLEGKSLEELNYMRRKGNKTCRLWKEKEIGSQRIHTFARIAKKNQKKKEMDKYEYFQKENEENESRRLENQKKADARAIEKARKVPEHAPAICVLDTAVVDWKSNNPQRYQKGILHFAKVCLEEHPSLGMLSNKQLGKIAKARLNAYLEKKFTN